MGLRCWIWICIAVARTHLILEMLVEINDILIVPKLFHDTTTVGVCDVCYRVSVPATFVTFTTTHLGHMVFVKVATRSE
ncbi:hypothetical protein C7974DRAFT_40405 [Boeremia exigua]|uniref:uncharacterized protein n=1 Tax=Boeremia exigua TaxID=749465 RepID=UPI001E8DC69E|nr:uncharacterized protein C7974DRAFT_40405 [Boeremia exigua]KAH6619012.1 hypothetical protein C7974DRAFT_40405 [Boeremia exigua]